MEEELEAKAVEFIGSTKKDLKRFPEDVRVAIGHGIWMAQNGERAGNAKVLKGFGGAGVLELIADHSDGNTYRGVYTISFPREIYVLHAFIKKSKRGIKTPQQEIELIRRRFALAAEKYKAKYGDQ
jgi:phage-related protein